MMKFYPKLLLVTIFVANSFSVFSQFSQIRFEKLDNRDGLSHNRVNSIYKDELGFMWFCTTAGINRYDGQKFKYIGPDENDPYAISNRDVVWLKEGPQGHLWIKTNYGVFAYDIFRERFVDISGLLEEFQIINYNLRDIVKDRVGDYWLVIDGIGVKKYISKDSSVHHFGGAYRGVTSVVEDPHGNIQIFHKNGEIEIVDLNDSRVSNFVKYPDHLENLAGLTALIDADGDYWFYSSEYPFGACYYDMTIRKCRHFTDEELGSNLVSGIIQDNSGRIIIGSDHGGLTWILKNNWQLQNFKNNPADPNSLSHNSIVSLYQDPTGLIWIGTNKGGVNYYSPESVSFNFYKQTDFTNANINDILPMLEDKNGNLWLGTDGGGLVHFNLRSGEYKNYSRAEKSPDGISSDIIVSMSEAADGGIWLGTYLGGLNYFDGKKFTVFRKSSDDPNSISDDRVWDLFLDSRKNLWVGTIKNGVDLYDSTFTKIKHFDTDNGLLHSNYVTSFCEDQDGKIWIGTGYGIEVYDPRTEENTHYLKAEGNPKTLVNNSVLEVYCDRNNNIWVGTLHGLSYYDQDTQEFTSFHKSEGLPSDIVSSILEDNQGNMWLGTYKGISKMVLNSDKLVFENFDISDGLQGEVFNFRSACKLTNGQLAFGGKHGFNVFNPENITASEQQNKLVFLDFYVSNHLIKPGEIFNGKVWFENGVNNAGKIVLDADENSFTVEFTSLSFYQQENTVYKYRLAGFDDEWVERPNVHRANYTNLDPGKYRFEVIASDQNHQWMDDHVLAMDIEVLAPFWRTPVANVLYVVVVILILFLTRRSIIQKERFRARVSQEQMEAQRLHELDLMKIKFFTNISHEFRTPLTLILTPIERMLSKEENPVYKKNFELIQRNASRLLSLVNQLLDFRKMEANQHKLSLSTGDIVSFARSIVESFSDLSSDRHIRLDFKTSVKDFLTLFDRDKIEKVMFNLLSNAFKFTNPGGVITVEVKEIRKEENIHTIQVSVSDTGIGIPEERQKDIFKRFFQVENKQLSNLNHGSGIGLSITKEFVEMHNGSIRLESKEDKGSTFIVELPMKQLTGYLTGDVVDDVQSAEFESEPAAFQSSKSSILIAEDNSDFRFYLKDNLREMYNIFEAPDGKIAWREILDHQPDLVVTDIMMPEIDGIDLCKKIKNDPRTAHIPVILLTAHYSDDQKLEGFEAGATEYITKPFNFEILVQAIKSAVQLQKLIHASEHRIEAKPQEIEITSLDEKFIGKAMEVVEANISNANFSVMELSREMAVSRGQLYKKTLELTGITPIEFIRTIRLKRAAALLEKSQMNVAEVAYKVGFNNPKYFTKYFKKQYHVLPSKYQHQSSDK